MKKLRVSDAVLAFGFSLIILLTLARTMSLTFRSLDLVIITFLLTAAFALMSRFKWLSIVLVASAILFLIVMWRSSITASFVDFLGSFIQWTWGLIEVGYDDPGSVYMLFTLSLLCLSISLPVYLLVRYNAHVFLLLVVGTAIFFVQQRMGYPLVHGYFWAFIFLIVLYAARQAMPQNNKSDLILLMSVPLCLALLAVTMNTPASDEPAGETVVAAAGRAFSRLPEWMRLNWINGPFPGSGGNAVLDYGDVGGDLGGEVILSDATVMFVKGDRPVYLKGRSYETFTGRRWETEGVRATQFRLFEASVNSIDDLFTWGTYYNYDRFPYENWQLPITAYLTDPDISDPQDSYETVSMSVHYWDISTDKVYSPYWAVAFQVADEFAGDVSLYKQPVSDIISDSALKKGFSYTVKAIIPKMTDGELTEMYRKCRPGFWNSALKNVFDYEWRYLTMLSEYSARAAAAYIQLPDSTTGRTIKLAEDITAGLDNYFDKAAAIESYLRTNYTYNTSPPELPGDADFADHFLFEGKEGYCTYFATAMAVLCRSVGIPARYVEGYAPSDEKREDFYVVTGKQAHAWVEVYLEGAGWVPFEPTSAYPSEGIRARQAAANAPRPSSYPIPSDFITPEPEDEFAPNTTAQPSREETAPGLTHPLVFVAIAVVLIITVQIVRRRVFLRRVRAEGFSAADAERLYGYFIRGLRVMKLRVKPCETPMEFAGRADRRFSMSGGTMTASAGVFGKVRYGAQAPSQEDHETMLRTMDDFEALLKRELGWKIIFLRYIIGVI